MRKKRKYRIVLLVFIGIVFFLYWQNNDLVITRYEINLKEKEFEKIKIVQISDLHNKEFGKDNIRLIRKIKQLKPDVIFLTGDFIDSHKYDFYSAVNTAKQLTKIAEVYFVTGNHERTINDESYDELQTVIEKEGVHVLFNEIIKLNNDIQVIGLNDMCLAAKDGSLAILMEQIDRSKVSVLLAHEPQELNWYAQCGLDLVFSRHAPGGQMRIPFLNIGLVAPDQGFFSKYTSGIKKSKYKNDRQQEPGK